MEWEEWGTRVASGEHTYLLVGERGDTKESEKKQRWGQELECREWKVNGENQCGLLLKSLASKVWGKK